MVSEGKRPQLPCGDTITDKQLLSLRHVGDVGGGSEVEVFFGVTDSGASDGTGVVGGAISSSLSSFALSCSFSQSTQPLYQVLRGCLACSWC